jgi:hypothetical protein
MAPGPLTHPVGARWEALVTVAVQLWRPAKLSMMSSYQQLCHFANQWIGLRENLQETIDFPIKYGTLL